MNAIDLSVLIPNYNHSQYLIKCIDLVLKSLPNGSELIIIDDASTDHSVSIIKEFEKKDFRIRFLQNKTNKGVNYTANRGLKEARGTFFTSVSADDCIASQFFHDTLKVLKKHPSIALCCSNYAYSYEDNIENIKENILYNTSHSYEIFHPDKMVSIFRKSNFWVPGHTSIYRRDKLLSVGGFKEDLKLYSDFYLNHKLALEYGVGYIPKALSIMRIHKESFTSKCSSNKKIKRQAIKSLLKKISKDPLSLSFRKSHLLKPLINGNLRCFLFNPKYWKYFNFL